MVPKFEIRSVDGVFAAVDLATGTPITESNGEPVIIEMVNGAPHAIRAHSRTALTADSHEEPCLGRHPDTVRIVDASSASGFVIINASDFNDATMTLYTD